MTTRYRWNLCAAVLALALVASAGGRPAQAIDILPLDEVRAGMKAEARTVLRGTEPEGIEIEILGVLDGFIGAEIPLILGRFVDEKGRYQGVAAGMSGSPVTVDGRLLGALSYSIGAFTREPICGITPIETMLALEDYPERALEWHRGESAWGEPRRLPLALSVRGLASAHLDAFDDVFGALGERYELSVTPAPRGAAELGPEDLLPGTPITALLVWGASEVGATGTVTWREGGRFLAFGHPFIGSGRAEMPVTPSEVVFTVASELNSFKLSRFGPPSGTLTQDRATAVSGVVGPVPEGLPIRIRVERPGAPILEQEYFIVRDPLLVPALANFALRSALLTTLGAERDEALTLFGHVRLADGSRVPLAASGAGGSGTPAMRDLGGGLVRVLSGLAQAPLELPNIEEVRLEVASKPRAGALKILRAMPDRLAAKPGEDIDILVEYSGPRGQRREAMLSLTIPERALAGTYTLFAGSQSELAGEFGSLHEARRRSARSAPEYIAALADIPSDTALEVALALPAEGIVSRGRDYPALPGTAHILLRSRPGGGELYRSRWLPLASVHENLGRTIEGHAEAKITISESIP